MKWLQVWVQGDVIERQSELKGKEIIKDLSQTGSDGGFSSIALILRLILHPQAC